MKKLLPEQIVQAREWRGQGLSWRQVGLRLGVKQDTVRRTLDAEFLAADRAARGRRRHRAEKAGRVVKEKRDTLRPTNAEFLYRAALIPPDHTDLTAIFFGDPKSGRSALDKLRAAGRAI